MDAPSFRQAVRALAVKDMEGREWILGPEDGQWHHRQHDRWVTANPPRRLVCPGCGHHNLTRHSFCVECGRTLMTKDGSKNGSRNGSRNGSKNGSRNPSKA